ncbi:motility protein A [Sphingomonas sp. ID0503]|uniref:motility protein A n=1 Tax=Sphingomonas sp. ID0503 TaxID=3399691 RepID=UPI003AFB5768
MTDLTPLLRLIDPAAVLLVCGGSVFVAALHGTRGDLVTAFRALGAMRRPFSLEDRRAELVRLERLAKRHGFLAIEHEKTGDATLDQAVAQAVDGVPLDALITTLTRADEERRRRHTVAPAFWCAVADAAPAMGMIGTILGLIQMFANLEDVTKVGPAMALALLTTLYGAVFANGIAGPISARLTRLAAIEDEARIALQRDIVALARTEVSARPARRKIAA